jgi:SAM-dependent methyltransferase
MTPNGVAGARESLRRVPGKCCICPQENASWVGTGQDFEYGTSADSFEALQCRTCGLVYLDQRPAVSELGRIYPPEYHAFDFSPAKFGLAYAVRRRLEARRALRWCRGLDPQARILDVGCGDGFHLRLLREFGSPGWRLEGVDLSERAVSAARRVGLTVHRGDVQNLALADGSYDLALLIATIEHVEDPLGVLTAVRRLLRPGGRVVIVTDNTEAVSFALFKRRHWGGYHFPRHWHLFNPQAVRMLAMRTALEIESLRTLLTPVNWVYSIRNALVDRGAPPWLYEHFSLSSPISLGVFTIFDGLQQLLGRGGLLEVVFRRPVTREQDETAVAE